MTVYTGKCVDAGSFNNVFIKANGKDEDSKHTKLVSKDHWFSPFTQGEVSVESPSLSVLASAALSVFNIKNQFRKWMLENFLIYCKVLVNPHSTFRNWGVSVQILVIKCTLSPSAVKMSVVTPGVQIYCVLARIPRKAGFDRAEQTVWLAVPI